MPTVPSFSQLRAGILVHIVLKADQRTGRLTPGHVAEILTRGDHPRGVKVRLMDGKVGRVQSLGQGTPLSPAGQGLIAPGGVPIMPGRVGGLDCAEGQWGGGRGHRPGRIQQDYRLDEQPAREAKLEDYVTFKPAGKGKWRPNMRGHGVNVAEPIGLDGGHAARESCGEGGGDEQAVLEKEFPGVDTALIAAIVAEGQGIEGCREVLRAISSA